MADTTSIFYKIGGATKTTVANAITALKAANNIFTGTNDFQKAVVVGTDGTPADLTVKGGVTVTGDLEVQGVTTTLSTTNLDISDNIITVNNGANDSAAEAPDAGFLFERASGSQNGAFLFEESSDRFELGLTAGTGAAVSLGAVSLGALAVNGLLIGTRASTTPLGDLADFNAGLTA